MIQFIKYLPILITLFLFTSCSKEEEKISYIKETSQEQEMITIYNEGYDALNANDPYSAAKKFLEAELLFPQSKWASKSILMASYSYYLQNYYAEAISNLERYIKTYPNAENIIYAQYLIGMCYYEMIEDEKRDIEPIIEAKKRFDLIITKYPSSEFALDAKFKVDFIEDLLASKEMYAGRHYQKKGKWIAAINRFKFVIEEYDETIFVEEALHRLVEINFKIGLLDESQRYAQLLGYNYLSSDWYKKSYKVLNKNYKEIKIKKRKKKGVIDKFKNLFD